MVKALFRKLVSRPLLDQEDLLVQAVRAKAPQARGAAIFFHKGLGDLVLAIPSFRALRELGPVRFFLADGRFVAFLEAQGFPSEEIYPWGALRTWRALIGFDYDYCINFDSMEISRDTRVLMLLANARLNVGYDSGPLRELIQVRPTMSANTFMADVFGNLTRCVGGNPDATLGPVRFNPRGDVVMHIGGRLDATGFDKRWPLRSYLELAKRCAEAGWTVRVLWGPGDPDPRSVPDRCAGYEIIHCATTEDLLGMLKEARLFVCNNTGVLWIASLVGVPTISFGAPFFFPRWDPRTLRPESSTVVMGDAGCACTNYTCRRGNCVHALEVDTVFAVVHDGLEAEATP